MPTTADVVRVVDAAVSARGFRRREADGVVACWVRRGWNTLRAVLIIEAPRDVDPAAYAKASKPTCSRAIGFRIPGLYHPGMQVIVVGGPVATPPREVTDRYDNQWCVLQAVHVVDLRGGRVWSGATWGQIISGPDQLVVARAIEEIVESGGDGEADHDEGSLQLDSRPMPEWWKWAMLAGLVASAVSFLGGILTLMAI